MGRGVLGLLWQTADRGGVTERRPRARDRQVRNNAGVGGKVLLDSIGPELAHILQLLYECRVVENAEGPANHGLIVKLVSETSARSDILTVIPHERRTVSAGVRRFPGHSTDWIHFRIG